jgi:hypothetical protein
MDDAVKRLDFYSHIFPTWVDEIRVYYDHEDNDGILAVKQYFSRRFIKFYVGPAYANSTEEERDEAVLHEIAHMFISPLSDVIDTFKDVLVVDPQIEKLMEDQTEKAEEYMVVDLIALLKAAGLEDEDEDEDDEVRVSSVWHPSLQCPSGHDHPLYRKGHDEE